MVWDGLFRARAETTSLGGQLEDGHPSSPTQALAAFSPHGPGWEPLYPGESAGALDLSRHWLYLMSGCLSHALGYLQGHRSADYTRRGKTRRKLPVCVRRPARDSPAQLAKYVRYFNPRFLGATGKDDEALHALTGQLGLLYKRAEGETSAMGYLIDHSASIMLIDPEGRLAAVFSSPHDPRLIAEDFKTIVAREAHIE